MYKNIVVMILLLYAVFGSSFVTIDKTPEPEPVSILNIDIPLQEIKDRVAIFGNIITDPSDKAKIAIFNYEFANRISGYNTDNQKVNDVYSLAGKIFFQDSMVDKYDNLAEEIVKLLKEIITDDNHLLTQEEKDQINQYFKGIAWVLIQKE